VPVPNNLGPTREIVLLRYLEEALAEGYAQLRVNGLAAGLGAEIAGARAADNGWAFSEPFAVRIRRGWLGQSESYEIETNADKRGTKARFIIDALTGEALSEGYIPR